MDNIQILPDDADAFPSYLKEIHQPPTQLYCRGNIDLLKHPLLLAVVGSRRANAYGKQSLQHVLPPAINRGLVTVSGLAFGIDALAHRLSLAAGQPTIAVLGSGIDDNNIYPRNHVKLAHEILDHHGLLITEHPPGTKARPYFFPERNRIISGLCPVTLIVQAAAKSGTLVTARLALEQGRDVAVIPGSITDPLSYGPNRLLHDGAYPVIEPADIYELFSLGQDETAPLLPDNLSPAQTQILSALTTRPQHVDELSRAAKLDPQAVSVALIELELLELVRNLGNLTYVRT